jgi:hypothetical protein
MVGSGPKKGNAMNGTTAALVFVGLAIVGVGAYFLMNKQSMTPAPAYQYPAPPPAATTNTQSQDNTAHDWATGINAGLNVLDTVLDKYL